MLAVILAALVSAAAPEGTVFTNDGGRVRGSLVEAGPAGVTVMLADGTTRRYPPTEVRKVVLADGSLWRPGDPPPAAPAEAAAPAAAVAAAAATPEPASPETSPAPTAGEPQAAPAQEPAPAAVAAVPLAAAASQEPGAEAKPAAPPPPMIIPPERLDTLFLSAGGRLRALVTEDLPEGVVVRLVDGSERRYAPGQIARIAYADGTASTPPAAR